MVSLRFIFIYVCLTLLAVIKVHTQEAIVKLNTEEVNTFVQKKTNGEFPILRQHKNYHIKSTSYHVTTGLIK